MTPRPPPPPPAAVQSSSSRAAAVKPPPPPPQEPEETDASLSPEVQAKVTKMAKPRGPESWTQTYCSSHIGVSFPVRNDWWYHSFGTTTSFLWHVEIGPQEIQELGDGPIAVNLVSGRLEGQSDGSVVTGGSSVIGYRSWTNGRHVQVVGPLQLKDAVTRITENIGTCEG